MNSVVVLSGLFLIVPIILTIFVWPKTTKGTSVGTWFHFSKVYSALAGCMGFCSIIYRRVTICR
ncbi:MAG: DUF5692 family protein [Terrisporobacter sp.]